jgi:cytochrome c biogenesis protein ResB
MTESTNSPDPGSAAAPRAPGNRLVAIIGMLYRFLTSTKLALGLLIAILTCCIIGVTIFREQRAGALIFGTLWFNGLLVLLVVNVACCFFGRIWGRKLTLISFGMILFHLSFVAMFAGIIYNSLFYFRGVIRLTEGETLPSGDLWSYDDADHGRFFALSKLKGETSLIKMHTRYKVDGADKRAAYEIAVGEGSLKKRGYLYITNNLDHDGFTYLPDKEGFSILTVLYDKRGRELYGAYIPLQSLRQKDSTYLYATGTKEGPGNFQFPQDQTPLLALQMVYHPSQIKERAGDFSFKVSPLAAMEAAPADKDIVEGRAALGDKFRAGEYFLSAKEVRYWVRMNVRHEPGKPIVLASLWVGLAGMVITTIGRIRRVNT